MFEAWTLPEHLAEWWGPDGFSLTTHSMDFSNGGIWSFTMHGADGQNFKNRIQYLEIKAPSSIVYKHAGDQKETEDVQFQTRVTFKEVKGGTQLEVEMEFPSAEELDRLNRLYGAIEGAVQHLTNLGRFVESRMEKRT